MPEARKANLRQKLFTLLVLSACLVALGDGGLIRQADADQISDIAACNNAFDGGLSGCKGTYDSCLATCVGSACVQCGPDFGDCFGGRVNGYSTCLGNVTFTMDMCPSAYQAAQMCEATRDNCLAEYAMDNSQENDCLFKAYECRLASGIDQCQ